MSAVKKGDVIWVPYRKDPLWPALVQNVYSKKVSHIFFPVDESVQVSRASTFSCATKLCYALLFNEDLGENVDAELKNSYLAACIYMRNRGMRRGSDIRSRQDPPTPQQPTPNKRKSSNSPAEISSPIKKLLIKDEVDENDEEDNASCSTTTTASFSDTEAKKKESESPPVTPKINRHRTPSITLEQKSREVMVIMNENIQHWFDEMWQSDRVKMYKQPKRDGLSISFRNNLLTATDFDNIVDRLVQMIRRRNPNISLIISLHIISSIILPHCMISCLTIYKSMTYERAMRAYAKIKPVFPKDGLDELCRIACIEREALLLS